MTKHVTLDSLRRLKTGGEKFACLTVYDASFATLLAQAGVDVMLVGDSLGNVIQGYTSTLPVTIEDMIYHCRCVRRGAPDAFIMADMPFLADATPELALANAGRLMKEGGAQMVKLEGGGPMVETVRRLAERGVPVCAHLGLQPQSVYKLGGYKVQGKDDASSARILEDARAMQQAGADMVLLECVPAELAGRVTKALQIPVIGIGAGVDCDAQVLVLYDMLGITPGKRPKFSQDFLQSSGGSLLAAVSGYVAAVKEGTFPGPEHSF